MRLQKEQTKQFENRLLAQHKDIRQRSLVIAQQLSENYVEDIDCELTSLRGHFDSFAE